MTTSVVITLWDDVRFLMEKCLRCIDAQYRTMRDEAIIGMSMDLHKILGKRIARHRIMLHTLTYNMLTTSGITHNQ